MRKAGCRHLHGKEPAIAKKGSSWREDLSGGLQQQEFRWDPGFRSVLVLAGALERAQKDDLKLGISGEEEK